jgi:predicted NUDIX family NTP pyrophosphohydrolase
MKRSAGILFYRWVNKNPEYFLVHPGGPFWQKKDLGAWSIPKGEIEESENPLSAAIREVKEETGITINIAAEKLISLSEVRQGSGKIVLAWAIEMNIDTEKIKSNFFQMEWPPRSGKNQSFPEIDKAEWFSFEDAGKKILPGQTPLLEELNKKISELHREEI